MPECLAVSPADRAVQAAQQREPGPGDRGRHRPAVAPITRPRDQATLVEPVEQAGEIRVARQHPLGDRPVRERLRPGAAEDPQHVILRKGQILGTQDVDLQAQEVIRGQDQGLEDPFLEAELRPPGASDGGRVRHGQTIFLARYTVNWHGRMAPLIVLVVATLLARLAGRLGVAPLQGWAAATRAGLAVMLCVTASAHFNSMRPDLVRMVPPAVPNPELMVTFTGVCEVLGAIGLLIPRTRRLAAVALILFLLAVLPANIHAARQSLTLNGAPVTALWPRVLLQGLFIVLVWWSGLHSREASPRQHPAQARR